MKWKKLKSADFQEDYLLNSQEYDPHFPGLQIQSFCHSLFSPEWQSSNESRPYIQVVIILSGRDTCLTADGERIVRHADSFFFEDLNYRKQNDPVHKRKQPLERYFVLFHSNPALHSLLLHFFPQGLRNFTPPHPARLIRCFEDIRRVLRRPGKTDCIRLGTMGYRLLAEAAGQLEEQTPRRDTLALARDYIENNFCDPALNRKRIAAAAGINPTALGAMFRTCLHTTVNGYVLSRRMEKAKIMLKNTKLPVKEIAAACGFTYAYYFSKVFKTDTGLLPGQYRKTGGAVK